MYLYIRGHSVLPPPSFADPPSKGGRGSIEFWSRGLLKFTLIIGETTTIRKRAAVDPIYNMCIANEVPSEIDASATDNGYEADSPNASGHVPEGTTTLTTRYFSDWPYSRLHQSWTKQPSSDGMHESRINDILEVVTPGMHPDARIVSIRCTLSVNVHTVCGITPALDTVTYSFSEHFENASDGNVSYNTMHQLSTM